MILSAALKSSELFGRKILTGVCSRGDCDAVFFTLRQGTRYCSTRCASWKGGRCKDSKGYIRITLADGKVQYEHRIVLEEKLQRPLQIGETVHHIDGDKENNEPDNLELWMSQPAGQRVRDLISIIVKRYPEAVRREFQKQ